MGHRFLKHVTRNRILLHLVDISSTAEQIGKDIITIRNELAAYDNDLLNRPQILVFTKADLLDSESLADKIKTLDQLGFSGIAISSQSGLGVTELLDLLSRKVHDWNVSNAKEKLTHSLQEDSL